MGMAVGAFEERIGVITGGLLLEDKFAVPDSSLYEKLEPIFIQAFDLLRKQLRSLSKKERKKDNRIKRQIFPFAYNCNKCRA